MKIILFSRPQIAHTAEDMGRLLPLVERYGFDYAINQEFAEAIEQLLGMHVNLKLWVKVRPDWRNRMDDLRNLGYDSRK